MSQSKLHPLDELVAQAQADGFYLVPSDHIPQRESVLKAKIFALESQRDALAAALRTLMGHINGDPENWPYIGPAYKSAADALAKVQGQ